MRRIGDSDLEVTPLALGANVFSWTADDEASHRILDAFTQAGGNLIDTSDSYGRAPGGGRGEGSERIIGEWLAATGRRDDVTIVTKVSRHPELTGLAPETVARAAAGSLARLGTDHIDLYFAHFDDESVPLAETFGAFDALITQGAIRYWGLSNYTPQRVQEVLEVVRENGLRPPVCLQPQYNLVERQEYESGYAPIAEREGFGVLPYFALASGFLTGKYDRGADVSAAQRGPMVEKYFTDKGFAVVETLREVAAAHSSSPATVALAWLLSRPGVSAPIASASRPEQVPPLLESVSLELAGDELDALDRASA